MALGILDGKPFDSPVHEGILVTCMLELLPYDDSDKPEFSEERFHSYLSRLEEERKKEPPEPESQNQTLMQIQQALGQMAGQMKELQSSVTGISHTGRYERPSGRKQATPPEKQVNLHLPANYGSKVLSKVEPRFGLCTLLLGHGNVGGGTLGVTLVGLACGGPM